MALTHKVNRLQGMWLASKARPENGASMSDLYISRLECIQDAMQVHLDRLEKYFPERKVAIVAFHNVLECFIGKSPGASTHTINPKDIENFEQGMDAARTITNRQNPWKMVGENIDEFRKHVRNLSTKGSTALGPALAVALGLARQHKQEYAAATEIFLCTDGASNTGIGSIQHQYIETSLHGRSFYSQAGEIALNQSAKINIIGLAGEDVALDVLAVASQVSGGVVTTVQPDELRREIRSVSQRRGIASDVTVKLHMPNQWHFVSDPRPGVAISANTLTYTLPQVNDETSVGFAFAITDKSASKAGVLTDTIPFQAHITYTSTTTGNTNVRVLNKVIPVTTDRECAENAAHVALTGTYYLQKIAFQMNQVLIKNLSFGKEGTRQLSTLRDTLYASHQLLIRAAKTTIAQEELANFSHESNQLDRELELVSSIRVGPAKDRAVKIFSRTALLSSNSLMSGSKKIAQVNRRNMIR